MDRDSERSAADLGSRKRHETMMVQRKDMLRLGVAVTAFAMKGDEERIREGGCEAYLSKPISVGKFIETVRRFIG